ncbi:hypothetical protein NZK32_00500 [Cyanobium sp. FGCU-52]|nr:hypothetical protein [Cyanobium sp. FGCU52]
MTELSFPAAIEQASSLLALWERGELSDEVLADRVAELVASRDGARGFFVASLPADNPLMDRLPEPLVLQLRAAGGEVVDLTARNLAMSTAMEWQHRHSEDEEHRAGSERVQARSTELLRQLDPTSVKERLERLLAAAAGDVEAGGEDVAFLERWGYNAEQKQAIARAIEAVAEPTTPLS